jgi:hypothetical protein
VTLAASGALVTLAHPSICSGHSNPAGPGGPKNLGLTSAQWFITRVRPGRGDYKSPLPG